MVAAYGEGNTWRPLLRKSRKGRQRSPGGLPGKPPRSGFKGPCMGYNVRLRASSNKKRLGIMDDRQQRQVNEAAEKFAEAIRESFQAVSDRTVSAQQLNAELTQN